MGEDAIKKFLPGPERAERGEWAGALREDLPGLVQHITIEGLAVHA